jgi:DNA (cytosine-5)-methyltransferase 1
MIVEAFAGPGGWDEGLAELGMHVTVGIESDETACATRRAAGHHAICADASLHGPEDYPGITGFIASPPCQGFSSAGKGAARDLIPEILNAIHCRNWGERPDPDPKVWLIVDLGRWVQHATPEWFAFEQVPSVLPIWHAYELLLRERGYSTWTGILNSADFGVPQTRQRAILMASRTRVVHPPVPTHAADPVPALFGTLEPWVTMADALGWGMNERPAFTVAFGTASGGADTSGVGGSGARPALHSHRDEGRWVDNRASGVARAVDLPPGVVDTGRAWGQTPEGGSQRVDGNTQPAPSLTAKSGGQWVFKPPWPFTSPATTVAGDPRITARCHHDDGSQGANAKSIEQVVAGDYEGTEPIRLSVRDALILQSFRADYPVQGTKTKQFEQIGNAVPPRLAMHIIRALVGD